MKKKKLKRRKKILEKEIFKQNYERILKIKEDFDARKIDIEDIPDEDVKLILDIYNLQIKKVNAEIVELKEKIEQYKTRIKDAIEYLNDKNSTKQS